MTKSEHILLSSFVYCYSVALIPLMKLAFENKTTAVVSRNDRRMTDDRDGIGNQPGIGSRRYRVSYASFFISVLLSAVTCHLKMPLVVDR